MIYALGFELQPPGLNVEGDAHDNRYFLARVSVEARFAKARRSYAFDSGLHVGIIHRGRCLAGAPRRSAGKRGGCICYGSVVVSDYGGLRAPPVTESGSTMITVGAWGPLLSGVEASINNRVALAAFVMLA